jgi:hypothetical protein
VDRTGVLDSSVARRHHTQRARRLGRAVLVVAEQGLAKHERGVRE